jgi:hypothetical protein
MRLFKRRTPAGRLFWYIEFTRGRRRATGCRVGKDDAEARRLFKLARRDYLAGKLAQLREPAEICEVDPGADLESDAKGEKMIPKYYGVVGNRDHIKIKGEKIPFWHFLDEQPDGWLTSLVYQRKENDYPEKHMIYDCGAWSYRNEAMPRLGKLELTPENAFEKYLLTARPGDTLIAPDHMLIPGTNIPERKKFNLLSAQKFIQLFSISRCQNHPFLPMATIHGETIEERIEYALKLKSMGYWHLALGGLAAQASRKKLVLGIVKEIRKALPPNLWLHILGLSSPDYVKHWKEYRIHSYDGSSHFKQAFIAGAFFMAKENILIKYSASKPCDEEATAPLCYCAACSKLREESIDTRYYGSNEHNMGRAAHNMNMLMRAQKASLFLKESYFLISCTKNKRREASFAKDLYISQWFTKCKAYVTEIGHPYFILSAKHKLLHPNLIIDPYDMSLNDMSGREKYQWSLEVANQIMDNIPPQSRIIIFAGKNYRKFLVPMLQTNYTVEIPLEGYGIGEQLSWFDGNNNKQKLLWENSNGI